MTDRVSVLLPIPLTGRGPSYTCGTLAREFASHGLAITIVTPRARGFSVLPARAVEALPPWTRYLPYRWLQSLAMSRLEAMFLSVAKNPQDGSGAAYLFPDAAIETVRALKSANIIVFREMINCHRGTAKRILDDAYGHLGIAPRHGITDASVIEEQLVLEEVDYIFCASPMVEASLLEQGLSSSKLLQASYGWDPTRFAGTTRALEPSKGITAVFAGSICVRKGAHLLLKYWAESEVKGRLVCAGGMEPAIKERCASLLQRNDVVVLDYVEDIGGLYRSADFFIFPTLEEGGPQVVYEACGCGLPVLTTPMGAGRMVRHEIEGLVIDPYDGSAWVRAMRALAADAELRRKLAKGAIDRAKAFCWSAVAARRRDQILDCIARTGRGMEA